MYGTISLEKPDSHTTSLELPPQKHSPAQSGTEKSTKDRSAKYHGMTEYHSTTDHALNHSCRVRLFLGGNTMFRDRGSKITSPLYS